MDRRRAELFHRVAEAMETAARLAERHADRQRQAGNDAATATERHAAECAQCRPTSTQPLPNGLGGVGTTSRRSFQARILFTGNTVSSANLLILSSLQ